MRKTTLTICLAAALAAMSTQAQAGWAHWLPWHHTAAPIHPFHPKSAPPLDGAPHVAPGLSQPGPAVQHAPTGRSGPEQPIQGPDGRGSAVSAGKTRDALPAPGGIPEGRVNGGPGSAAPNALDGAPSVNQFTSTQSTILLINKQIEAAKLDVELQKARNELRELQEKAAALAPTTATASKRSFLDVAPGDPKVLSIQAGPASPISATIELPQGVVIRVHDGDMMPDGWKVEEIRSSSVTVGHKDRVSRVYPLLTIPDNTSDLVSSDLSSGLPPMPPVPEAESRAKGVKSLTRIPAFPVPKLLPAPQGGDTE